MNLILPILAGFIFFVFAKSLFDIWDSHLQFDRYRKYMRGLQSQMPFWGMWLASLGQFAAGFAALLIFFPHIGWFHFVGGLVGIFLPWIHRREVKQSMEFERLGLLPDFLDLFSIALSSGLNMTQGWRKAVQFLPESRLKKELSQSSHQIELGRPFDEVIVELGGKWKDFRLVSVLNLLQQGLRRGFPINKMLFERAESLRKEVLMEVERKAETAKVKLLFPIVFFIFPAVFVILFGSLLLQYAGTGKIF